jgi:hypothetical protein
MSEIRVKIQNIIENQIPDFIRDESPLFAEFLKQYYISQEYQGGPYDIIQNIDKHIKLDEIFESSKSTILATDISFFDTTIQTSFSTFTKGFPEKYGIIKINNEIITYTSKTDLAFEGCIRGFSGIESISGKDLIFSSSSATEHSGGSIIYNLSGLFLQEYLKKIKKQLIPGFSDRSLEENLNQNLFIKQSKDFYSSKGTDESFKILFNALYGEKVTVIKPRDYLFRPSDAGYRKTRDIVVEPIFGNPLELLNKTLYQDEYLQYGIEQSYASITNVEKIFVDGKEYYQLSFDFDFNKDLVLNGTVYGNFSSHPKTQVVSKVSFEDTTIDVDSTVGFPNSGILIFEDDRIGQEFTFSYSGKSITQFYNVKNIPFDLSPKTELRLDAYAYGYSGIDEEDIVKVRVSSVLNSVTLKDDTYLFSDNDVIKIKSLGISSSSIRRDNWIDNISNTHVVKELILIDSRSLSYEVTIYDSHNFKIGDRLKIISDSSEERESVIIDILDSFSFIISEQGLLDLNRKFKINRNILKVNSNNYNYLNLDSANVQNTYTDYDDNILVASPSIPFYYDESIDPYNKKLVLSGEYNGEILSVTSGSDHGFFTGDKVYYSPFIFSNEVSQDNISKFPELDEGLYYIKRVDSTRISLAKSLSNLYNNNFISVSGIVISNTIEYYDFNKKILKSQNILREIRQPINESGNYETTPGKIGILVNGVEILNYKSFENIFYGKLEEVAVISQGTEYDVINPPNLKIIDSQGIGATGICAVNGSLKRIEIIDTGFDYLNKPKVIIIGGNGKNAFAEANTTSVDHNVYFNSEIPFRNINLVQGIIGFTTYHKFRDYEKVIYFSDGQKGISGLTTQSSYYISIIDEFRIKIHEKESDAILGINTITFSDYGIGEHRFKSAAKKQIITDIVVRNGGEGYQNKQKTVNPTGISTALNQINIPLHGYNTGEELVYSTSGNQIGGINTESRYLVKKLDDNNFKLANIGFGTLSTAYFLETEQYVEFSSSGSGVHSFNYPPISVIISGNIGVSTISNRDFSCVVQPIFRGSIDSIHLLSNGLNYGSEEVINHARQPTFELNSGSGATLVAIVSDKGTIIEVLVSRTGSGYNSPPNLVINGKGKFAKLTPIIENGKLIDVKVINGGFGYNNTTTINVVASGKNCKLRANIQKWTVNLFQKYFNNITNDDGIITVSDRTEYGLQYCHLYAPRKLRESLYARSANEDLDSPILYGIPDLRKVNNEEISSTQHSPIIGWAYDGNPIYGPYAYSTPSGGIVKSMKSGYEIVSKENRPSTSVFPIGFFIEDYEFKNSGDLDIHNGRFGITPDFPNGVYAYFSTINQTSIDTQLPFNGYRRPTFPFLIGNSFYSKPNEFNFDKRSNQDDYDLNNSGWFRNTTNYKIYGKNSSYDYIFNPDKIKSQIVNIRAVSSGFVDNIGILTGGQNYSVNDRLIFDNSDTKGFNASALVSKVHGKNVTNISAEITSFDPVEFTPIDNNGKFVGFTTIPHSLKNNNFISISGFNNNLSKIQGFYPIGIRTDSFITTLGIQTIGITGLTTYFYVSGLLEFPYIRENDILGIGTQEKVKVLNVEAESGRIRVLREYDSTVSSAYSLSTVLFEDTRKFVVNTGFKTEFNYSPNREIYFDPSESVGIGTTLSVGAGTTVVFSLPGIGASSVFIPLRSIYLKNHNLQTGEKLVYSSNGGSELTVYDGKSFLPLPQTQDLYAVKFNNNLIGISTTQVEFGTTGSFVGIGTTNSSGLLFFEDIGTGSYHSFKTKRDAIFGEISRNVVTVATASTHGLLLDDTIEIVNEVKDEEIITVKYNDYNRRSVYNPKSFTSNDVNVLDDTVYIPNHGFNTGDKVIYTSEDLSGDLEHEKMYYVLYHTNNKIRLCSSKFNLNLNEPVYVNFTDLFEGTLSSINPQINVYKNKILTFDLSDSSLSYLNGPTLYSAFDLNIYLDSKFNYNLNKKLNSLQFQILKTGNIGIDSTAKLTVFLNNETPKNLYYRLEPINKDFIGNVKKEIIIDSNVKNFNQINLINSEYSGKHTITGIGTTNTFQFNLTSYPEKNSYDSSTSNIYYTTNSTAAYGSISDISIISGGNNYKFVPGISTVISEYGSGAIFDVRSNTIGKIVKTEIESIGFDYPTDYTLSPDLNLPEILKINPLSSFADINVSYSGKDYLTSPELVIIDAYTKQVVNDADIRYNIFTKEVKIVKNTYGIHNANPIIIPINNSNGYPIRSLTYNSSDKSATITFNLGFSDVFPFLIGDRILIENTIIEKDSGSRGFNSSEYGFNLFKVIDINPSLGGNLASLTYDLSEYLKVNEIPGIFDPSLSLGKVISEKDFPKFDIKLKKNDFLIGENVFSDSGSGVVLNWNNKDEYLKVAANLDFNLGDILIGESSGTRGIVDNIIDFIAYSNLSAYSDVKKGWIYETGFLNNNIQRIHDNNYYQYFSYSLKSKIPYEKWNEPVSSLNHTSGFLKFSNLEIDSEIKSTDLKIVTNENVTDVVVDFVGTGNLNCVYNFDLVFEETDLIGTRLISNEIVFSNRILTDYFESIGNRVLSIDNISRQFNSSPRATKFSEIYRSLVESSRSQKFIIYVRDRRYTNERQVLIVTSIRDNFNFYINQYGRVETNYDMGSFDLLIDGTESVINYFPTKFSLNDFDITTMSYNIKDGLVGFASTNFDNIIDLNTNSIFVPIGTRTTIINADSSYSSSIKALVELSSFDGRYQFNELTIVHNGSIVEYIDYGQLSSSSSGDGDSGFGTFYPYIESGILKLDFIPKIGIGVTANVLEFAFRNDISVGISKFEIKHAKLQAVSTSIASSTSPTSNVVCSYGDEYDSSYLICEVTDITNNERQVSEIISIDNDIEVFFSEFGNLETFGSIGTFGFQKTSSINELIFTPNSNIDVNVKVYMNSLKSEDDAREVENFSDSLIETNYGTYFGTEIDVRRQFELTHKNNSIFQKEFDGSNSDIVNIDSNSITIPNHFFVTGEKVNYGGAGAASTQAISIEPTDFGVGIGITDKLPSEVYIIKVNDNIVKLAKSAKDALLIDSIPIELTSVGIETTHALKSINSNSKVLVAIDNAIQSPINKTSVTSSLSTNTSSIQDSLFFAGITSFFSGDFIQVNNEIMRIESVSVGATNEVRVIRPWLGTTVSGYSTGTIVTKLQGNYNIEGNTIHFASAPYGNIPLSGSTNPPNERDWIGITTSSTFQGRVFLRSGLINSEEDTYQKNYIFDDISDEFNGSNTDFILKSNENDVTGISEENAIVLINGVFQGPQGNQIGFGNYSLIENSGITSIRFTGSASSITYDVNNASVPVGGVIVSVGSTNGFGFQPLVSAGGTAIVSGLGTISSISIGNSGSGYRVGIQTLVRVGIKTEGIGTSNITFVGIASISDGHIVGVEITNPGFGYTTSNPPLVIFDSPLSYSNIPLIYSNSSTQGVGTESKVDIIVGQGSSVIDFTIRNNGYGYGQGEILTVEIGGNSGIPIDSSKPYSEFQIFVDKVANDSFSGWSIGNLEVLDSFESLFDGSNKRFPLKLNGNLITIRSAKGSNIDVRENLLIFINDILQEPVKSYLFNGGSIVEFIEAPREEDTAKILFYKGTEGVDVRFTDVLETIKVGDEVTINYDPALGQGISLQQDSRIVTGINTTDSIQTTTYVGPGITTDNTILRPLKWCRQVSDKVIDGNIVGKSREEYEPQIYPSGYLIKSVGIGSTIIYVDNISPFFNAFNENQSSLLFQKSITIISQDNLVGAIGTCIVSSNGSISSVDITNGGFGYLNPPNITFESPTGIGTKAISTSTIENGVLVNINLENSGSGYTSTNPPSILIETPTAIEETNDVSLYEGDSGVIVGFGTTTIGYNTQVILDLFIPENSYLRQSALTGTAITVSSLSVNDYFVVYNSNVGSASTTIISLDNDGNRIGVATQFIDNVYQVNRSELVEKNIAGVGTTYVTRVFVNILSNRLESFDSTLFTFDSTINTLDSIGGITTYSGSIINSNNFGNYSWGRIELSSRSKNNSYNSYGKNGFTGISTSALVKRTIPLRYRNYIIT